MFCNLVAVEALPVKGPTNVASPVTSIVLSELVLVAVPVKFCVLLLTESMSVFTSLSKDLINFNFSVAKVCSALAESLM